MTAHKFRKKVVGNTKGQNQINKHAKPSLEEVKVEEKDLNGFKHISPLLAECAERIQKLHELDSPTYVTGIPTGFAEIDLITRGLQPGELILVAGCPSMGKTAFVLNIVENVAINGGLPVAIFSMKLSGSQVTMRMLLSTGRLDFQRFPAGCFSDDEWSRLSWALGKLNEAQIYIDESDGMTFIELCSKARQLHQQCGKLGLIVVDYVQLLDTPKHSENQTVTISRTLRAIKALAKDLDVPIIVLSQLLIRVENLWNKRPTMLDLRKSGINEHDVDVVIFLFREEHYDREDKKLRGLAECIIGKQRNGPTETVKLAYIKEYIRFESIDDSRDERAGRVRNRKSVH